MTCGSKRAHRTIPGRSLVSAGVLLSLLACSDRSAPPASSRKSSALPAPSAVAARQMPVAEVAAVIGARLASGPDPTLGKLTPAEQTQLKTLYGTGGYAPLWINLTGRPGRSARDALTLLNGAATDGLDPADYGWARLDRLSAALEAAQPSLVDDVAIFDVALSAGMLRYLRHLHTGRVDPRTIGFRLNVSADRHDLVILLRSALADERIAETAAELAPQLVQYRALRAMLARYRSLATDTSLASLPPPAGTVRPGEPYAGVIALYRRLVAFGDFSLETPEPAEGAVYTGPLVEGVKRFQIRHGFEGDGVLGKATQAALQVSLTWRVRQIELALERLRWLPDLGDQRFVGLNIPMFTLWAWDSIPPSGAPSFGMRAIVGRALSTQTPVFVEEMRYVIVRPYWNVPPSILRHEILPVLERDLDYLRRQDMEIVRGPGDDAQPVGATTETIALLRQGSLRLRQRPGPRNALGLVKLVFPNDETALGATSATAACGWRTRPRWRRGR